MQHGKEGILHRRIKAQKTALLRYRNRATNPIHHQIVRQAHAKGFEHLEDIGLNGRPALRLKVAIDLALRQKQIAPPVDIVSQRAEGIFRQGIDNPIDEQHLDIVGHAGTQKDRAHIVGFPESRIHPLHCRCRSSGICHANHRAVFIDHFLNPRCNLVFQPRGRLNNRQHLSLVAVEQNHAHINALHLKLIVLEHLQLHGLNPRFLRVQCQLFIVIGSVKLKPKIAI